QTLAQRIATAIANHPTPKSEVAIAVVDGNDGDRLYANSNAGRAMLPASNMKLVTSATTLDIYGADAVLPTVLATSGASGGEDLVVVGLGDPAFGDAALLARDGREPMDVFDDWADALRDAGVTAVAGDVVVVDAVFDDAFVHPTWSPRNRLAWYGAPIAGVNFNTNCVDFYFEPTTPGRSAEVRTVPPEGGFVWTGTVASRGKDEEHGPVLGKRAEPTEAGWAQYVVRGGVRNAAGPFSKPVDNPRVFFGETLRAALVARGIAVHGEVRINPEGTAAIAANLRQVARHETPLLDVMGRVNTDSQNMMAEGLAKLNGLAYERAVGTADSGGDSGGARGSWGGGHLAAVSFLRQAGIDTATIVCADGSGLSRENRVSAASLADLLGHMLRDHEHGEHYVASLAAAGRTGSLRRRLKELEGRVWAKTGTINGVSALSGYVFSPDGRGPVAAFSVLHNGQGSASAARRQQDAVVRAVADWLDAQPAPAPGKVDPEVEAVIDHLNGLEVSAGSTPEAGR
ncbi:MAG: D-alanyl-D-alanine carboxypeptidase/D-alanyl-D-alanine-endopeptidase, partial [Planctomycetota bacterium]